MCLLGLDRASQTNKFKFAIPVPKILELDELVEESKFIAKIIAPNNFGG
jgi:hypothetical protein